MECETDDHHKHAPATIDDDDQMADNRVFHVAQKIKKSSQTSEKTEMFKVCERQGQIKSQFQTLTIYSHLE